jgi:putative flavoprotein involved in K+ transport
MAPRELIAFDALDKALSAGEAERAVDLFQADCYWRDLVTFT